MLEGRRRRDVRDAEPADARPPRRDHRSRTTSASSTSTRARRALRRSASATSASLGLFGSPRYMEIFDEERREARPAARQGPAAPAPPRAAAGQAAALRRDARARTGATPIRGRRRSRSATSSSARPISLRRSTCAPSARCPASADVGGRDRAAAPACIWCGRRSTSAPRHRGRLTVCGACGAATTDPPPDADELAAAYGDWYRPDGRAALLVRRRRDPRPHPRAARLAGSTRSRPPGPVLDVGAGDGTLVDALRGARARGDRASSATRCAPTSASEALAELEATASGRR